MELGLAGAGIVMILMGIYWVASRIHVGVWWLVLVAIGTLTHGR